MTHPDATASAVPCHADIAVTPPPDPVVRYTSGQTIYTESGDGERWLGRYWSADGRINVPYESWAEDAFELALGGQVLRRGWTFVSAAQAPDTSRGGRHFVVELAHQTPRVRLKVHTVLDGTPVLTRWLEIANASDDPLALTEVAPWSGRLWPGRTFTVGYYTQDIWACEGWFEWHTLPEGYTRIACDKGQGFDDPFFVVRNEVAGEYFIGHLAWSANWRMTFNRDREGLCLSLGPEAVPVQRVLAPGETVVTPAVHLGHTSGSLDTAVQAMHDHLRRSVLPQVAPERGRRVQYLVPADQGFYRPFDESSARKCVEVAAEVGAELFILDAYWWDVTCDWEPSASRFPNGLEPLVRQVRDRGMLFGLYVETEGGRGNVRQSRVAREHPDWFGPRDILDLTNPAAAAWMEAEICRLIERYDLDLYRLDYNPGFTHDGPTTRRHGIVESNYWRYYEVFYDLYERLALKYPRLILQQCAAGGARNDLGTASRFHETYLTDGLSLPRELQVYSGLSLGLPPEILVILHGADGGVGMGKPQGLDTVLRLTFSLSTPQIFAGTVAPSVEELSPIRRERFRHYGRLYREFIRPLLPNCRAFHHEPVNARGGVESGPWFAMEFAAPERDRGWATLVRLRNGPGDRYVYRYPNQTTDDGPALAPYAEETYVFRPRGLDPGRRYRVTFDSLGTQALVDGLALLRDGIPVRLENAGMSELLLFEAV